MKNLISSRSYFAAGVLLLVSFASGWLLASYVLDYNIGINADSIKYLTFAENLSKNGLTYFLSEGLVHYPPFYPLIVSLIHNVTANILYDAVIVNQILFGLNMALFYSIAYYFTRSIIIALTSVLLTLSSPVLIQLHSYALSEPLFLFLAFTSLGLLAKYLTDPASHRYLYLSCITIALSIYTRYAGLPLIIVGWVAILIRNQFILKRQLIKKATLFAFLSLILLLFNLIRNKLVFDNTVDRNIDFYLVGWSKISWLLNTIATWFSTFSVAGYLALLFFISIVAWYLYKNIGKISYGILHPFDALITTLVVFSISYTMFIYLSATFADPHIPFDNRIFSPLYLSSILLMSLLVKYVWNQRSILVQALLLLTVAISLTTIASSISTAQDFHNNSGGYNQKTIVESDLLKWLKMNHHNYTVFSNYFDLINFHLNTNARPLGYSSNNKEYNTTFLEEARSGSSAFVYFKSLGYRPYFFEPAKLEAIFDTQTIHDSKEGILLITE